MPQTTDPMRDVRRWLWAVASLVAGMVMLGGATRLTGSGLSITEWNVVTGVFPPLTDAAWLAEFEKYKAIPQYQQINKGMSLADFKFIYFWEWAHRLLGRIVGFAFAIPLAFFWWRGKIGRALGWKLVVLLFLGGLQGFIGWWMVASGLSVRTDVSQYRLAIHLTLACIIFVALIWVATTLLPKKEGAGRRGKVIAVALIALSLVQVFFGAIVAKTNAGLTFNTWPLIDGVFHPKREQLFLLEPWWRNIFENVMAVQFNHRMTAYLLWFAAFGYALWQMRHAAAREAWILFALITAQAVLGIVTLLYAVPLALGLAHQAGAVVVLAFASYHAAKLGSYN
ncbi:MAG: COX15/CtaA family protein [Xanthobacteraceae bacterium]|nr:COX15/CtaA family protein [Xanthobacteraceae bacterium]